MSGGNYHEKVASLLIAMSLLLCAGCRRNAQTTEERIQKQLPELLEGQLELENIYRGAGLPTDTADYIPDENGQCFVPVTDEAYNSADALKQRTEAVFTQEYAEATYYSYAFSGDWPRYRDVEGQLCMDIGQSGALDQQWSDQFEIIEETDTVVKVQVPYMTYGTEYQAEISLVSLDDGTYRIDQLQDMNMRS